MEVTTKRESKVFDEKFDVLENKANKSPERKTKTIDVGVGEIT